MQACYMYEYMDGLEKSGAPAEYGRYKAVCTVRTLGLLKSTVHLSKTNFGTLQHLWSKTLLLDLKMFFNSLIKLDELYDY